MGWRRVVGSLNCQLSLDDREPYLSRSLLKKRPDNVESLQIVATPSQQSRPQSNTIVATPTESTNRCHPIAESLHIVATP